MTGDTAITIITAVNTTITTIFTITVITQCKILLHDISMHVNIPLQIYPPNHLADDAWVSSIGSFPSNARLGLLTEEQEDVEREQGSK